MAQARSAAPAHTAAHVKVIAPAPLGATAIAALGARGIEARAVAERGIEAHVVAERGTEARAVAERGIEARAVAEAAGDSDDVIAWALDAPPTLAAAAQLASACARAAAAGRPVCLFAPAPRGTGRQAIERAAALAYLRAHGAALAHDIDAWLEAVVLLVRFGLPEGPRAAVIAPAGSWLEAQAAALANDELRPVAAGNEPGDEPTDVALFDPALGAPPRSTPGLHVPVIARGELAGYAAATLHGARGGGVSDGTPALHGARAALGAVALLGRAAQRIAVGLGPAPRTASAELAIDDARLHRQLDKLAGARIGDHETKVLLAAYGVPITRQAVATTPSAAVKLARRAGFPVELKPWGHDIASEPAGCPVERNITSDALVRQAFASVLAAAGRAVGAEGNAVIVRETPPPGRDVSVQLIELPAVGWTVVLDAPGAPQLAAAPAPLRLVDAEALAAHVVASRASDPEPDRAGLANVLRRASHLVVDLEARLVSLELPRIVVGGRGARTLVVDASATLR